MAGWRQAVALAMTGEEIEALTALSRSRTEPAGRVSRAAMLLGYREKPSFFAVGGVDRAGLLAQPAIDAFDHINVVAGGTAGAVVPARAGLDDDGLRRTDRLAELAGDAALLAVGIAAQYMLAAEARR